MATFKLPELGEGLTEGEVVAWKVKEGDTIKADQTIAEIMTDKATVEVPSPYSGVVKKVFYKVGELAKVGAPLVDIEVAEGAAKAQPSTQESHQTKKTPDAPAAPSRAASAERQSEPTPASEAHGGGLSRVLASPAVRRMAREMNLDLQGVQGTGDRGRVLRTDLESATKAPLARSAGPRQGLVASASLEERLPFIGIRRKIAEHLTESNHKLVHFTHFDEVDFTEIIKLREEMNVYAEKNGLQKLSYLPFFIKGSIAALKKFPILNSTLDEARNEVVIKYYYHYGISVQTDNGLMVAVVRDCDKKDLFEIAKDLKEVADRARSGKASLHDLTGSTITITNPGNIGGLYATPIINFPESAILGMFQIKKRPVVREVAGEDVIVPKPMMYTNITCDHRVVDGAIAAGYMRLFCEYMENPARMAFV